MSTNLAFARQLNLVVQECIECGVSFGMPAELDRGLRDNKKNFYCPNGHPMTYTRSEADRLRAQLEAANREATWQKERAATLDRRLATETKKRAKLERRIAAGVCPCCQRTVSQLSRHMRSKHPDYATAGQQS